MEQNMFCYQCQETAGCSGCTKSGVCGKRPETAALQDLLIWTTKGLSAVTTQLRREGKTVDASVNHLITENLFTTITNVNFDDDTIRARIEATLETKALLAQLADCSALPEAALWNGTTDEFAAKAVTVGVLSTENEDIRSLRELITYGLKGLAAYTSHANVLLKEIFCITDDAVDVRASRITNRSGCVNTVFVAVLRRGNRCLPAACSRRNARRFPLRRGTDGTRTRDRLLRRAGNGTAR